MTNKKCECKLPYVNNGTARCTECGEQQGMFLPVTTVEKPISVKREFNGSEFQKGDIVEVIGKSYCCLVEIIRYIPHGWYGVKIPNGGYHETQILGDKVSKHQICYKSNELCKFNCSGLCRESC